MWALSVTRCELWRLCQGPGIESFRGSAFKLRSFGVSGPWLGGSGLQRPSGIPRSSQVGVCSFCLGFQVES